MNIDVPFKYNVQGIEPRCRNSNYFEGYDTANVIIRDVPEEDCPVALDLWDEDGGPAETFRHFEGDFWIRNSRVDDTPFGRQHIMLTGNWPRWSKTEPGFHDNRRFFQPYGPMEAKKDNVTACHNLSTVGLLAYKLVGFHSPFSIASREGGATYPIIEGKVDGTVVSAVVDPTERFRIVETSSFNEKRQAAVEYAQANVIAIDGTLWHRVPQPMIYATDKIITWAFNGSIGTDLNTNTYGSPGRDRDDTSLASAYKMAMTEYDRIPDSFPDAIEQDRIKFHIEYIDPALFERPDIRPLILKDIKAAMHRSGVLDESTPYVHKWLELRDLVKHGEGNVAERDDAFLDAAADIIVELDAMLGKNRYPGAAMWANRQVDVGIPTETPRPRAP